MSATGVSHPCSGRDHALNGNAIADNLREATGIAVEREQGEDGMDGQINEAKPDNKPGEIRRRATGTKAPRIAMDCRILHQPRAFMAVLQYPCFGGSLQ